MRRLARDLGAELELLEVLAAEVQGVSTRPLPLGQEACAYLAWKLHGWYTALESLLERIARTVEGAVPAGPTFHRDLPRGMTLPLPEIRPAVLRAGVLRELAELLAFRHFLRHAYAVPLDEALLRHHGARIERVAPQVREDVEAFVQVLLGWAGELEGRD
ncbi:MAG: hypothetical protein ABIO70_23490 [Pseudomonadota bacterium]